MRGLLGMCCWIMMGVVPVWAGSSTTLLDTSTDGHWLAAANRDNGTVSIVDLKSHKVAREIPVGHHPEGVTFLGQGERFAATAYGDDKIIIVETATGKVLHEVPVFDEPYGIVATRDGRWAYATLEYPGEIVELDTLAGKLTRTIPGGAFLRGIALTADEKQLFITEYLTGTVRSIDRESGKQIDEWKGYKTDNIARQIALHPTRPKAYVPHIRSRVTVNRGEGSVVPFVGVLDTRTTVERRRTTMPMDGFFGTFVVANPWEVAVSPDGRTACAVFAGTDDMYVCDVVNDDYSELSFRNVLRLGHNPRAVRFDPAGDHFYVYNTLDFEVLEFETDSLQPTAKIKVCKNPMSDEKLLGKILFYTALQPMVGRRWISCSSCHPDGDADGRTWHNPEGLRNTTALYGMAWTHPLHWSADRDESQDFEHTIRSQLMQGQGLVRGRIPEALGDPLKGMSKALDALAVYSNAHPAPLSPHAKKGLSQPAKRGQEIFFSREANCASCHSGPFYTDSTPVKPFQLHDVGTGTLDPGEKMGPKYDTPTLLNLYRTAPYLHHGQAATLEDVLRKFNTDDKHGKTSHLNDQQVADLVEFLKSLPYEDPEPAAKAARLTKVAD